MNWVEQNWVLFLLGALVMLFALWWWVGGRSTQVGADARPTPLEKAGTIDSPVVTSPAVAPIDTPPPAAPAPITPEPRMVTEAIHPIPAGPPDQLTRMKGIGPKVAALLNGLGVTRYVQIAAWTDADVERIDAQLGAFKGRVTRDHWIEQARLLASGDNSGYEAKFGKLG